MPASQPGRQLLGEISYALREVKVQEGLQHLTELSPDDKNTITFYWEITGRKQQIQPAFIFLCDDFSSISSELIHFTE